MANMKDIARLASVSVSTVADVFSHPERVSESNIRKVRAAVEATGYVEESSTRPSPLRDRAVGFMVADNIDPFFNEIVLGIEDVMSSHGWTLLITNNGRDVLRERRSIGSLVSRKVSGVFVNPTSESSLIDIRARVNGIPIVGVDYLPSDEGVSSVITDGVVGGRIAGEHLLSLGRTRVAFATNYRPTHPAHSRGRLAGLEMALDGKASLELLTASGLDFHSGQEVGEQVASLPPGRRPDAIFAANDALALGILFALLRWDIKVPGDIALIGYDDLIFGSHAPIPLTTIRQPARAMGEKSAEIMLNALAADDAPALRHVFEPELVARASTLGEQR